MKSYGMLVALAALPLLASGALADSSDEILRPPSYDPVPTAVDTARITTATRLRPPPLKLPDIEERTAWFKHANHVRIAPQLKKSSQVIRFFKNPRHRWMLATRKSKCSEVAWQRDCVIARTKLKMHQELAEIAVQRLDAEDPIITQLNRGLSGTPMAGLGKTLRDIGRKYNVSPFFIAAAAGTESSFGAAGCGGNPKNVWGLAACDGRWAVPYFDTWDEAITFYASFVSERWPSATSPYNFYGYAACSPCWGRKTSMWMTSRFGVSPYTKYPS